MVRAKVREALEDRRPDVPHTDLVIEVQALVDQRRDRDA